MGGGGGGRAVSAGGGGEGDVWATKCQHVILCPNRATLKKNFCFRSSGCLLLKPVGRPQFLFFGGGGG